MKRIFRFIKSVCKYIIYGHRVNIYEYSIRIRECASCDDLNDDKWMCKICGCYVDKKCKMSTEKCPKNKWS